MARKCEVTDKKPMFGNNRSKALNSTKRKWNVNLQTVIVEVNGKPKKMKMSTSAMRTMNKKAKKTSKKEVK